MNFNFDLISFTIGTLIGTGAIWQLLQHRNDKVRLELEKAKVSNELRNELFELMTSLKNHREYYSDVNDEIIEVDGIRNNILVQLKTEIDFIYDDILAKEKQLSKIENRKPRDISKYHGSRPPKPKNINFRFE